MDILEIDEAFVSKCIPARKRDSHKGMNGVVCVVGGSSIYHGAPFLTACGAMRVGVDLVYIATPKIIAGSIRALSPDFIVLPLPDAKLTKGNVSKLKSWLPNIDSLAIGPGLGNQNPELIANCINELKQISKSMVIDADALRKRSLECVSGYNVILTPHAGEFERVFSIKAPGSIDERARIVFECARENDVTILLKGFVDVISDGESIAINNTHTPSMTVGGTGDVLTGIAAGLMAKGLGQFEAACCAAFINGSAGIEATKELGLHITPSDLIEKIPVVMKKFDRIE